MLPDWPILVRVRRDRKGLNAPTGAWCSLTTNRKEPNNEPEQSQCTYRCVVLPDPTFAFVEGDWGLVSMHLQVRGAP